MVMGEAPGAPQAGGTAMAVLDAYEEQRFLSDAAQEALAVLRRDWGGGYEIGIGPVRQFAARRHDGGDWILADAPEGLAVALAADWGDRPRPVQ